MKDLIWLYLILQVCVSVCYSDWDGNIWDSSDESDGKITDSITIGLLSKQEVTADESWGNNPQR